MDINLFTQRLKEAREKEGLSLKELQARVGISLSALNNYVAGRTLPPLDVAALLAEELHVSLDWLSGINSSASSTGNQITNCYETALALDQILDLYENADFDAKVLTTYHSPDNIEQSSRITIQFTSDVLCHYYIERKHMIKFYEELPEDRKADFIPFSKKLLQTFRENILRSDKNTGLKDPNQPKE